MKAVFVTGTDTDVGKSVVSAWLCHAWKADYWKPIQSGLTGGTDSGTIGQLCPGSPRHPETYKLSQPLSPHLSAQLDGIELDMTQFVLPKADRLVVEGAGGLLVPINDQHTVADLIDYLDLPCLIVARSGLGTLNHTFLTLEACRRRQLNVLGVITMGQHNPENIKAIEYFGKTQVLAHLPWFENLNAESLQQTAPPAELLRKLEGIESRQLAQTRPSSTAHPQQNDLQSQPGLLRADREYCWHPFTQVQTAAEPLLVASGKQEFLYSPSGRAYFDAVSSWWVNLHGHAHPHIAQAIASQAQSLEHVMFAGVTHKPAVELAMKLIERAPGKLSKVFYSDNGSTAVEVALKMAFQYWSNLGQASNRRRIVSLAGGYHGDTFGAMAAGVSSGFYDPFRPWLFEVETLPKVEGPSSEADCLQAFTHLLESESHNLAALILEPLIQGASGMRMSSPRFVSELCRLAHKHGILVIFDEVMTGFGRTGTFYAADQIASHGESPDLICLSKGLTGGFMPMGATLASNSIHDAFLSQEVGKALLHGHSYTANPLGCAAALASLDLFESGEATDGIQRLTGIHQQWMPRLLSHPLVENPRQCGTVCAFELKSSANEYGSGTSQRLRQAFLQKGILVRPLGSTLYWIPPYCTSSHTMNRAYEALFEVLDEWGTDPTIQEGSEMF